MSRREIVQLARNAFTVSWLTRDDKERYVEALETYAANPR
jgi:adenosine deaminase